MVNLSSSNAKKSNSKVTTIDLFVQVSELLEAEKLILVYRAFRSLITRTLTLIEIIFKGTHFYTRLKGEKNPDMNR